MSGSQSIIQKADVINFSAILALLLFVFLVITHVAIVIYTATDKVQAFKDITQWAMPIILSILSTYGILKVREGNNQ